MSALQNGKFIISLDFELYWGVRDVQTIEQYGKHILGVHTMMPALLETFRKNNIKATFSAIGFLFFETREEMLANLPDRLPRYVNKNLSPYEGHFEKVGANFNTDLYHYAPQLIKLLQQYPEQEIGSHTFSHYYCLEAGQNPEDFRADLKQAIKAASKYNITLTSLVFPRNQFNESYISICDELGIICYRGNEHHWIYRAKSGENESLFRRAARLLDSYLNISGYNCYTDDFMKSRYPVDIPASRFLRPYSHTLRIFEKIRLKRIKSAMTHAAKNNLTYHLWWHPHNFGINQQKNFSFLDSLLIHYQYLHRKYNFSSYTMSELALKIKNEA